MSEGTLTLVLFLILIVHECAQAIVININIRDTRNQILGHQREFIEIMRDLVAALKEQEQPR